jgi:hypothetical protein
VSGVIYHDRTVVSPQVEQDRGLGLGPVKINLVTGKPMRTASGHPHLRSIYGLIARNKTGAQPVNFQAGESIVYAQPLPVRFHNLLHRSSNGDGFTPRQAKACNFG